MRRYSLITVRGLSWFLLAISLVVMGSINSVMAAGTDEQYPPNAEPSAQNIEVNALVEAAPGNTLVYFFTTDNDATATVIYLLNTNSVAHTIPLRGYSQKGVLVYSLNISLPATSMLRLASDSIAAAPPPSWAGPPSNPDGIAPLITNFTDFTYFVSLSLPKGVRVDGYTLFNPGTGVIDPRLNQGAMPIRFMNPAGDKCGSFYVIVGGKTSCGP